MKKWILLALILGIAFTGVTQDNLKKIKNIDDRVRTSQIFYVLKENHNIKQGPFVYKYQGKKQIEGQFENNKQVGEWTYTPGKKFKIVGKYVEGKKEGEWKYFSNDKQISVMNYQNGMLNGKSFGYYENGNLACELSYEKGNRVGTKKVYYPNQNVKEIFDYSSNGFLKKFNENGDIILSIDYNNGLPYNLYVNDDYADEISYKGNLKEGSGELVEYYFNNEEKYIISVTNYLNGKLHGQIRLFDRNGVLAVKGQFIEGNMVGMWEFNVNNPEKKYAKAFKLSDSTKTCTDLENQMNYLKSLHHKVETMPLFNEGTSKEFSEHVVLSLIYPKQAESKGIEGRVLTKFKVNQFGLLTDFEVLESDNEMFNKEAERVIRTSPLWVPGFSDQIPVEVTYVFPISFLL